MLTNSESDNTKSAKSSSSKQAIEGGEQNAKTTDKDKSGKTILRKNAYPSIVINNRKSEGRVKSRPRSKDEYTVGRGRYEDKRNFRGRGGGLTRKDREDGGYSRGRYELSSKPKSYGYSGNDYDSKDHGTSVSLPEDSRISAVLRKLAREDDEKKFSNLCKTLQEAVTLPDNASYVRRSIDMILDSLFDLFRTGVTQNCKILAAKCIGHVGYHLEKDFKRYLDWIFNRFNAETKDTNRTLLMKAIYELTYMDRKNPKLGEYAEYLMRLVRGVMESTDIGDIFVVTAEIILALTGRYSTTFIDYFHDTVDIIVGWHIDVNQPPEVLRCATKCLQRLSDYWIQDMGFTVTLLRQFLEDAEGYKEDIKNSPDELKDIKSSELAKKITSFICVYISLFQGLGENMNPESNVNVTYAFLIESMGKVMEIVLSTLEPRVHNELIIAGNKCATLILGFLKKEAVSVSDPVHIYIYSLMGKCDLLSKSSLSSLFRLIAKVLDVLNETVTYKLVDTLLQPNSVLLQMRLTGLQMDALKIYHRLLRLSSLTCFVQAYEHIVCDLEAALRTLKPDAEPFTAIENNPHSEVVYPSELEAEETILFLFRALTAALGAPNHSRPSASLKPNLFKIFAEEIPLIITPLKYPGLHHASLCFLKSHCSVHDYFIVSNGMVLGTSRRLKLAEILGVRTASGFEKSPTTSYLITIINLLIKNLSTVIMPSCLYSTAVAIVSICSGLTAVF